jgi:hypothetical protein
MANCAPHEIEISDPTPVSSSPYRCAAQKLKISIEMIDDLLDQGVVRTSKSPYVNPALLVPKRVGGFRLVMDYRKVNSKVVFDSNPMPRSNKRLGVRWCFLSQT